MENKKNTPLVSVVIPAYNSEKTIERACLSVLEQDYPNVELVVVNDGSRDDTEKLLDQLAAKHSNMNCIHQANGGVCRARNVGMDHAKGDYLFFLDGDDALTPGCLKVLMDCAQKYDADVVNGSFLQIAPDGQQQEAYFRMETEETLWEGTDFLASSLKDHPATHSACAKLYRSTLAKAVRFAEGKHIHEDSFYVFEICLHQPKTVVINTPVINRYMRQKSNEKIPYAEKYTDILYFGKRKYEIVQRDHPQLLPLAKNALVKAALATLNSVRLIVDPRVTSLEKESMAIVRQNAEFFIPVSNTDKRNFLIARLGLSRLYKHFYRAYLTVRH